MLLKFAIKKFKEEKEFANLSPHTIVVSIRAGKISETLGFNLDKLTEEVNLEVINDTFNR